MSQNVNKARTLIKFGVQNTDYVAGVGVSTVYDLLTVKVGTDDDGEDLTTDCFYCEWLGSYGAAAIQQQSDGIIRPARVRMKYVDAVYNALISKKPVIIYYRGIVDDEHAFTLASSADNYLSENQMLEFAVQKREVK